jgi:cytochrome P450
MKNLAYTFGVVYENLLTGSKIIDHKIQQKQTLDLGEFMLRLTFDTITQSAFDAKLSTLLDDDPHSTEDGAQYMVQQDTFLRVISANLLNPLKKFMFWSADNRAAEASRVFKRDMATRLIESYRTAHAGEDPDKDNSIMGHLLRNKYRDERDRLSDMMVFISAGHETTSWSMVWLLLEISRHPEVKRKLLDELDRSIPPRPSAEQATNPEAAFPSISKLSSLPYLSMCIKESMRLWPVAASGPRRITLQDFDFSTNAAAADSSLPKVYIPKGSTVQVNFFSMFRAGWIDRADEFLPERWSAENPQLPQLKEMFMPFSVGRRNCIGQNLANVELVMIAAYMLRYYDFKLVSEPKQELFLSFKAKEVLMEVQHRP